MNGDRVNHVKPGDATIPARAWNAIADFVNGSSIGGLQGLPLGAALAVQCTLVADTGAAGNDYLSCRIAATGEVIDVIKPPLLRPSIAARGSVSYTYTTVQQRTATSGADSETQVIVPAYLADDQIIAAPYTDDAGVLRWLDTSARAWAKQAE